MITEHNHRIVYPVLSILFPCILGIAGMIRENVSSVIWIQNVAFILLATIVCLCVLKLRMKFNYKIIVFVSILLLGLTFIGPNIDGVHRWLRIPFFTLNIATIVIPITIVAFYRLIEEKQYVMSLIGTIVIAVFLFLQPDASQLLAFSLPMIVLLLKSKISKVITTSFSMVLLLLTLKSWIELDSLQPINYTEGILTMVYDTSIVLYIIGIASLLWVPICFLVLCQKQSRNICVGITSYYWMMSCATFVGNFPVPFMGYGLSPILGFYFFLIWFINDFNSDY
jgi:hypothetical protein